MVAYNFKAQFAPDIEEGRKTQTMRPRGKKRHARGGEAVQLYYGMRSKACRKLLDPDPPCTLSVPVVLDISRDRVIGLKLEYPEPRGGGSTSVIVNHGFARQEGFASIRDMWDFMHALYGPGRAELQLICWNPWARVMGEDA